MTDSGFRTVEASVHDLDQRAHTVAVDLPHERLDTYSTDFKRGAFADSFRRRLPHMLLEHNPHLRIGDGLRAEVLPHANRYIGQFHDSPIAQGAFQEIASGKRKGWSFHFVNGQDVPHPSVHGAKRYVKADMLEVSSVPRPSIPGTATVGIRSDDDITFGADPGDPEEVAAAKQLQIEYLESLIDLAGITNNVGLIRYYQSALDQLTDGSRDRSSLRDRTEMALIGIEQDLSLMKQGRSLNAFTGRGQLSAVRHDRSIRNSRAMLHELRTQLNRAAIGSGRR